MRNRIYLAAPLFNQQEREFNLRVAAVLESVFDVYLPQRDGLVIVELLEKGMSFDKASRMIFDADVTSMDCCDALLAIFDGPHVDEGVAFEVGYMFQGGKPCFALQSDFRRQFAFGNNPMLQGAIKSSFRTVDEFVKHVSAGRVKLAP